MQPAHAPTQESGQRSATSCDPHAATQLLPRTPLRAFLSILWRTRGSEIALKGRSILFPGEGLNGAAGWVLQSETMKRGGARPALRLGIGRCCGKQSAAPNQPGSMSNSDTRSGPRLTRVTCSIRRGGTDDVSDAPWDIKNNMGKRTRLARSTFHGGQRERHCCLAAADDENLLRGTSTLINHRDCIVRSSDV